MESADANIQKWKEYSQNDVSMVKKEIRENAEEVMDEHNKNLWNNHLVVMASFKDNEHLKDLEITLDRVKKYFVKEKTKDFGEEANDMERMNMNGHFVYFCQRVKFFENACRLMKRWTDLLTTSKARTLSLINNLTDFKLDRVSFRKYLIDRFKIDLTLSSAELSDSNGKFFINFNLTFSIDFSSDLDISQLSAGSVGPTKSFTPSNLEDKNFTKMLKDRRDNLQKLKKETQSWCSIPNMEKSIEAGCAFTTMRRMNEAVKTNERNPRKGQIWPNKFKIPQQVPRKTENTQWLRKKNEPTAAIPKQAMPHPTSQQHPQYSTLSSENLAKHNLQQNQETYKNPALTSALLGQKNKSEEFDMLGQPIEKPIGKSQVIFAFKIFSFKFSLIFILDLTKCK